MGKIVATGLRSAILVCLLGSAPALGQILSPAEVKQKVAALEPKIIAWRRDIHQNPELGNRETRTSALVADHLRKLGLEVTTGIAHTGVVAVLKGALPGPVVALRADMDALPVTERVNVPFASKAKAVYRNQEVGVMHACGHDGHTAILMGVAELLTGIKGRLPGTVKFIFQPAEEGAPDGEEGGAALMIKQGVLENPKPSAIFGLHLASQGYAGEVSYRAGPAMAAADEFRIRVTGRQTHGSRPWAGVDPIVVSAQIVNALQTIVSRNLDITKEPAVVSVGAINGGIRNNIIPETVEMIGTVRTFDDTMQETIHGRIKEIAEGVAASNGAKAEVEIRRGYPVTSNDTNLTAWAAPYLEQVVGKDKLKVREKATGAEDFSFYQRHVPGFFFFVGSTGPEVQLDQAPSNHSPLFKVDESSLAVGAASLANVTLAYLGRKS